MSIQPQVTRRLVVATVWATVLIAANPFIVRLAYQDWNSLMVVLGIAPVVPLLAFAGFTLWQERHGSRPLTFAVRQLSTVLFLMSTWVLGPALLGYFVLLLGLVVLPTSAALLACAWVQPRPQHKALTELLGIAAVPLVVWFAGRADEYLSEALISGAALVAIVAVMFSMRRIGNRREGIVAA
ncbi:MAG TPA: hypothetical protein PK020_06420 [Ilumatobacteraceae bacterium]|nr:hypothetical protein [Ilumatobacteraceae bacterium]